MAKYKRVMVVWDDAVDHGTNEHNKPVHKPWRWKTVGWLLKRNKKGVSLCDEIACDGTEWRGESFIPAGMIVEVVELQ